MKFTLLINANLNWQVSTSHALKLAQSMVAQKHQLLSVFFYGEAVKISTFPQLLKPWQQLQLTEPFNLLLCRTMNEFYKISPMANIGFQTAGMSQLTQAMELADKVIEVV